MRGELALPALSGGGFGAMIGEGARALVGRRSGRRPQRPVDRRPPRARSRAFLAHYAPVCTVATRALRRRRGAARRSAPPLAARAADQQADRDDRGRSSNTSAGRAYFRFRGRRRQPALPQARRPSARCEVGAALGSRSGRGRARRRQPDRCRNGERRRSGVRLGGVGLRGGGRPPRAGGRSLRPHPRGARQLGSTRSLSKP